VLSPLVRLDLSWVPEWIFASAPSMYVYSHNLYIVGEEVVEHNMLAWLVYCDSGDHTTEEFEVESLLALVTPVRPHWEERRV